MKPERIAYLNSLGKQYFLSLYASAEYKAIVESALVKTAEDLAVSTFTVGLDDKIPVAFLQAGYHRIVEKHGTSVARLNATTEIPNPSPYMDRLWILIGQKLLTWKTK